VASEKSKPQFASVGNDPSSNERHIASKKLCPRLANLLNRFNRFDVPHVEVSPEVQAQLSALAKARGLSPAEFIVSLLAAPTESLRTNPLVAYTLSPEFRAKFSDADRYLALLAWMAKNDAAEFSDFIAHHASGRKYVGLSAEEIRETCHHNQARPIEGTHYWAIMNLDTPTKRRFLRRLLVFIGAPDDVITHVTATVGGR
jgi:negative regulator of replication initiation